jgi:hypothetical protein
MSPDPVSAVMAYLAADSDIAALAGARVFGGELPETEATSMPRGAIVVRESGGGFLGAEWQEYGDVRLDVITYGAIVDDASDLARAVRRRLKAMTRNVSETALLHWAKPDGGALPLRDPDTGWPYVVSSWQVLLAEVAAT